MMVSIMLSIIALPTELLQLVLYKLNMRDVLSAAKTCRIIHAAAWTDINNWRECHHVVVCLDDFVTDTQSSKDHSERQGNRFKSIWHLLEVALYTPWLSRYITSLELSLPQHSIPDVDEEFKSQLIQRLHPLPSGWSTTSLKAPGGLGHQAKRALSFFPDVSKIHVLGLGDRMSDIYSMIDDIASVWRCSKLGVATLKIARSRDPHITIHWLRTIGSEAEFLTELRLVNCDRFQISHLSGRDCAAAWKLWNVRIAGDDIQAFLRRAKLMKRLSVHYTLAALEDGGYLRKEWLRCVSEFCQETLEELSLTIPEDAYACGRDAPPRCRELPENFPLDAERNAPPEVDNTGLSNLKYLKRAHLHVCLLEDDNRNLVRLRDYLPTGIEEIHLYGGATINDKDQWKRLFEDLEEGSGACLPHLKILQLHDSFS